MGCLGIEMGQHQDELYWKIRRGFGILGIETIGLRIYFINS
jgi:hypothetical protein